MWKWHTGKKKSKNSRNFVGQMSVSQRRCSKLILFVMCDTISDTGTIKKKNSPRQTTPAVCETQNVCVWRTMPEKHLLPLWPTHPVAPQTWVQYTVKTRTGGMHSSRKKRVLTEESARWRLVAWERVATMLLTGRDDITEDLAWSSDSQIVGQETSGGYKRHSGLFRSNQTDRPHMTCHHCSQVRQEDQLWSKWTKLTELKWAEGRGTAGSNSRARYVCMCRAKI